MQNRDSELQKAIRQRTSDLREGRDEYLDEWRDAADFVLGYMPRPLLSSLEGSRKKRERNEYLMNEVALWSNNVLASGMMAGITSPARKWFELQPPDLDLLDFEPVKEWLNLVEQRMMTVFSRTNFYRAAHSLYFQMGAFGQGALTAYEDFDDLIRFETYDIGSYMLGKDGNQRVNRFYREYNMTVAEAVTKFGLDNLDQSYQQMWRMNERENLIQLIQAIEKNEGRDPNSPLSRNKLWRSVYMERDNDSRPLLGVSGFDTKPFFAPRWSVIGEDVYATSYPAFNAMGTNKSLQVEELDKATAIEKQHNPPLVGDSAMKNSGLDMIAGGITFVPGMAQMGKPGLAPVYNVNPNISHLSEDIRDKEGRIRESFYADLFLMISSMDRRNITATEIAERKEEKLLMLGPVLERLNDEFLDPVIDRVFDILMKKGLLPPPPQELANADLGVEYISVLAKAQKAISTESMDITTAFVTNLSQFVPEALDKLDVDEMIDEYSRAKGAPPNIIRSDDEVAAVREQRAQAQAQAQQAAQSQAMIDSAKTLSETPVDQGTALDGVLDNLV
jgi:hypothetical protein